MLFAPIQFLALMILVTAVARLTFVIRVKRHRAVLHDLARNWKMHFSARDRFNLSARLAQSFPVPGAAEIVVADLIYGTEGDFYRYIFAAEFTTGVTQRKRRQRRVATFREPRGRTTIADWSLLILAPEELDTIDQYHKLRDEIVLKNKPPLDARATAY